MVSNGSDKFAGFTKVLSGGFEHSGLNYAECIISKEPLHGSYLGKISATTLILKDGQPMPFTHEVPGLVGCKPELIQELNQQLAMTVISALQHPKQAKNGVTWARAPVLVNFSWMFMPSPIMAAGRVTKL